jgi:ElaB/YqjD/DUF883 family membrane-anchored ribosome-binding protein
MSRTAFENRTASKRNKQSLNGCRNGKLAGRGIEGDVLRTVRQFGSELTRSMKQRATGLRETAADCVKQGRKKARSLERSVERRIEDRPLTSLLAAAGLGLLVGMICTRRK